MKSIIISIFFAMLTANLFAQKHTFDIISYKAPADWTLMQGNDNVSYSRIDGASWAQIAIYQHRNCEGDIQADFDKDWNDLVAANKTISSPEKTEPKSADGWTVMSGSGVWQYNGANVASVLTVYSNNTICVAVLCNATAQPYLKNFKDLISSLDLDAPSVSSTNASTNNETQTNANANTNHTSIVGTWIINAAETSGFMNGHLLYSGGYIRKEYSFKSDGTYFYSFKNWSVHIDNILYGYETGKWTVNDNLLTLIPTKGMSGEWKKTPDTKGWGSQVKTNNWKLEKTTYRLEIHNTNVPAILRLDSGGATERDGAYTNKYFSYVLSDEPLIDFPPGFKIK